MRAGRRRGRPNWKKVVLHLILPGLLALFSVSEAETVAEESCKAELQACLDMDSATVGTMVALTIGYVLPEGARLLPDPEIKGLEDLTIIDYHTGPDKIRIRLMVDKLGSWKTGPLSLTYLDKENNTRILTTDPVSLTVLSNLGEKPEEAQLKPIQGIMPLRRGWLRYVLWGGCVVGILLIGLCLAWWYKASPGRKASIIPRDPPHIRAKKEIEELEASQLFEKGYVKDFYFRFSGILRRYLEDLRGYPAAEFTTQEIALCMDNEQDRRLLPLLRQADLVKFADTIPMQAGKEGEMKMAISYIEQTSPALESG